MKGQTRSAENEGDVEYFGGETVTKDSNVYRHGGLIQVKGCGKGIFKVVIRERGSRGIFGMAGILGTKPR